MDDKDYQREYYQRNKERKCQRSAEWRAKNRVRAVEAVRRCWAENGAAYVEQRREWYQQNKEKKTRYQREWSRKNRVHKNAINAARRARAATTIDRDYVYEAYHGCCGICGDPVNDFHLDHIVPLAKGGLHVYRNVQPTHAACNLRKNASWPTIEELEQPGASEPGPQGTAKCVDATATP